MDIFCGCFESDYLPISRFSRSRCVVKCSGSTHKATPLPKAKMSVILMLGFSNVFGSTVIFPFLPFMVQDFFPHLSKEEIGQQAGFLGSAYFIGNFAGSLVWGWLADTWGRRPTLMVGSLGVISSALLFGFSQSFAMAVTARFLWGLLNGTFITKTYLSEILDDSNQAKGFSTFGMGSGIGRIFGSVVGGFLAQPASKYTLFQNPFFCRFQYVLPIFINVAIAIVGLIGVFFTFGETLRYNIIKTPASSTDTLDTSSHVDTEPASSTSSDTCIELTCTFTNGTNDDKAMKPRFGNVVINNVNTDIDEKANHYDTPFLLSNDHPTGNIDYDNEVISDHERLLDSTCSELVQHQPIVVTKSTRDFLNHPVKQFYKFQHDQCIECCHCCLSLNNSSSDHSFSGCGGILSKIKREIVMRIKLLLDKRVILSVLTYGFVGGVTILSNEIYPLLLVTDHEHGGYNMDDNEIALFIMIAGVVLLVYQVFAYSRIITLVGYRNLLRISLVVFAIGNFLLPWANRITGSIGDGTLEPAGSGSGTGTSVNHTDVGYCKFNYTVDAINEDSVTRLPAGVWAVMLTLTLMIVIGRISSLVTLVVLINNSAVTETRGTVNGLGQSLLSVFRSLTPAIGSIVFAWSEVNGHSWPFNYHLMFELCAVGSVAIVLFTFLFPKSIEKKRTL